MAGVMNPGQRQGLLDQVAKGIGIARDIYGIKADMDRSDAARAEQDRLAKGEKTAGEFQDMVVKHDLQEVPEDSPGALHMVVRDAQGTPMSKFVAKAKKAEKSGTREIRTRNKDGSETIQIVPDVAGSTFASAMAPKDPDNDRAEKRRSDAIVKAQSNLNRDLREVDEAIASADQINSLGELAKINPIAAANLSSRLARVAGEKGILTETDLKRQGGAQSFQENATRYLQKVTTGQPLTESDIQFGMEFGEIMGRENQKRKEQIIQRNVNQYTRAYGGDFKENYGSITGADWKDPAPTPNSPEPPAPQGGMNVANAAPGGRTTPPPAHPQDKVALDWANKNILSPDAATAAKARAIIQANGAPK